MSILNSFLHWFAKHQSSIVRLSSIVIVTFFLAKAVNLVLAHYLLPINLNEKSKFGPSGPLRAVPGPTVNIDTILSRNLFDSDASKRAESTRPLIDPEGQIHASTLSAELLGTIVFQNEEYSVALIQNRTDQSSDYYSIGEKILTATIAQIERFRIIVENNGRLEKLEIKAAKDTMAKFAKLDKKEPPTSQARASAELEEIGPNHFVIPQSVIDGALKNFSKVLTQARMVPNLTSDNKTDGFRIFQIKKGSIYEKIGLKNNDILKRVNGQDLDSFEKATGLFTALRNENSISIDIVRSGSKVNYKYEVR